MSHGPDADVLIAGAGPAGAVAATLLARAGARVLVVDRARFPRDKLCGDTLNPGTLATLRRLGIDPDPIETAGLRVDGMVVTGETGVRVAGAYPAPLHGRALTRRDVDAWLVAEARAAGAQVEEGVTVRRATVDPATGRVGGLVIATAQGARVLRAPVTIAADGRHSAVAFGLGLARHPVAPRRWAVGGYFEQVDGLSAFGEMHVRRRHYLGIAPVPGGLANVCAVLAPGAGTPFDGLFGDPARLIETAVRADPVVAARFARARAVAPPVVLGPLAVVSAGRPPDGLLIAGDAAGFVDPMTGDGLHFAVRGADLAAQAALEALAHGWDGVSARVARRARHLLAGKRRFNRALRALVGSPAAMSAAAWGAALAPDLLRRIICVAGDTGVAVRQPEWGHV
ncbi:MAG: FAD-dependent monooxygenase [Acidobacteriota bacterium]|nr:FAD-dependent monooxygenase [Acidobacteriota bacterium]